MARSTNSSIHWLVRLNHRNRTWCCFLLFLTIGTHMAGAGYGVLAWCLLALQFLAYPQLLYWCARRSSDQRKTEKCLMLVDAAMLNTWAAALGFPIWITFICLTMGTVNHALLHGRKGFARAVAIAFGAALLPVALNGLHFSPQTGLPTTLLSILTVSLYIFMVAESGHARALILQETRAQLRNSELALKQQLDEINALQAQLRDQVNRDPLTGLYNRRYFDATLERELARCKREQQGLSVVMIDIDHFKRINDSYGHQAGDEILKLLAVSLNERIRASDVACRYGGEEFLLLLPKVTPKIAIERAEQWRAAFAADTIRFDGAQVRATISAGIASYPEHGETPEELIRSADLALYCAKSEGRNRVTIAAESSLSEA
jgi:diguanylate cyclase